MRLFTSVGKRRTIQSRTIHTIMENVITADMAIKIAKDNKNTEELARCRRIRENFNQLLHRATDYPLYIGNVNPREDHTCHDVCMKKVLGESNSLESNNTFHCEKSRLYILPLQEDELKRQRERDKKKDDMEYASAMIESMDMDDKESSCSIM